jgi:hypothetical protein
MRRAVLRIALALIVVFFASAPVWAQWATPTIDGSIMLGEYGNNNSLSNAGNTGQTWYMTWDAANLYVGIVNTNLAEGAVIYVTGNPQNPPTCCSNTDGNLTGFQYDITDFASLPFRAKFVTYHKGDTVTNQNVYREYRNSDANGDWATATSDYGVYAGNPDNTNTREVAIPWSAITNGGGIPSSLCILRLSHDQRRLRVRPSADRQQHRRIHRHERHSNDVLLDPEHRERRQHTALLQ